MGRHRAGVVLALLLAWAVPAAAQTTGTVSGGVVDERSGTPIVGAVIRLEGQERAHTLTTAQGKFLLAGVPAGDHAVVVEVLGYNTTTIRSVPVRAGRVSELVVRLTPAAVGVRQLVVRADRVRLIEPTVSQSHTVVDGEALRALPIDNTAQAIELATGVSQGHFRGGRVGQESYVVDGLEVKNQLEASRQGLGLEFSPSSLEEVEVVTGGFGAEHGSALSGVVSYVTRRGDPERWETRLGAATDHWAPASLLTGFTGASVSAGGPVPFLGRGSTLFVDFLGQGYLDAEPRSRGLTCLGVDDAPDDLGARIRELTASDAARLHCPYTATTLPHQQGEKLIGFARVDRPLPGAGALTLSVLRNRNQNLLYTPDFKYNSRFQLGQRTDGTLATMAADWTRHASGSALQLSARGALMRLDRHLGALDLAVLDARAGVAGVGLGSYAFLGEAYVRRPIEEQLAAPVPVPGYVEPGGTFGSPFGPAAEGIFFTEGTPHIANWNRTEMVGGDLTGEWTSVAGHQIRAGGATRFYRVENYERVLSHLPASALQYTRFYPATVSGFVQTRFVTDDGIRVEIGARTEAFRSGLGLVPDRNDFLAPVLETGWKLSLTPRLAAAIPIPGTEGRSAVRFNYGMVSQPPDFRYFLDSSIGDSLRTDIRRQGNPNLAFERGTAYETGVSHLVTDEIGVSVTVFYKQLRNLATGALGVAEAGRTTSSLRDHGSVRGVEFTVRAQFAPVAFEAGYALQKAVGVSAGTDGDTLGAPDLTVEYPLAFDRRHSVDLALYAGRLGGFVESPWSAALTTTVQSGYPIVRVMLESDTVTSGLKAQYMPWTAVTSLRLTREFESVPGCGGCQWRIVADGRSLLGLDNVVGVRRETGRVGPRLEDVERMAAFAPVSFAPIPREDARYSATIDLDRDGEISESEFRQGRFAAALDRYDPSIFYGEARQLRLGLEVSF